MEEEVLSDASGESSDAEDSVESSELTGRVAAEDDDEDDDDDNTDDDSEWEDVDEDECVTDADNSEPARCVHSAVAADSNQCDSAVCNCPDLLTGPQLIKLLRALCHEANSHADVHTVGLVCICFICIELNEVV